MILCVAERLNDPAMPDEKVSRWAHHWRGEHRLRCILSTPALTKGAALTRLNKLIGLRPDRSVNLLWPDNRIGTWDAEEAALSAAALASWLKVGADAEGEPVLGLVLLGNRVRQAFGLRSEGWGSVYDVGDLPPILLMPHPSGRNRLLNNPAFCARLRASARRFVRLAKV